MASRLPCALPLLPSDVRWWHSEVSTTLQQLRPDHLKVIKSVSPNSLHPAQQSVRSEGRCCPKARFPLLPL